MVIWQPNPTSITCPSLMDLCEIWLSFRVHFTPPPSTRWSPNVTYIGAMLISDMEKANIIKMTRMLTTERAYGSVSRRFSR